MTVTSTAQPSYATGEPASIFDDAVARPRRPTRRSRKALSAAVLAITTVLGLWFGLTAPSISPVAPALTAQAIVAAPAGPVDAAGAGDGSFGEHRPAEHRGHR